MMKLFNFAAPIVAGLALMATSADAVSIGDQYIFSTSVGTQPANVGVIKITQTTATSVTVLADLLPGYGFINTGGPHTPFAFTISGSETGMAATFVQPAGGVFGLNLLSLNTGGGDNTPYGTYGVAIDSSGGNGSNPTNAYYGDLEFGLTRTGGLTIDDFIANATAPGYYFSADLTNGQNTGAQGWATRLSSSSSTSSAGGQGSSSSSSGNQVPESSSTLVLLGLGILGIGFMRRRKQAA